LEGVTSGVREFGRRQRKTAAYFFHRLRQLIAEQLEDTLRVDHPAIPGLPDGRFLTRFLTRRRFRSIICIQTSDA
jgi:hypothetical protein